MPQELGKVLINLNNNAFFSAQQKKAQIKGQYQPEIKITTCRQNEQLKTRVRDYGNGIPESEKN